MTTSEWKCRLFYKANPFESIHITNRIDSIRIANWNALLHNTHQPTLTLEFHNFELFKSCRTSSFCTVAWQLSRFQLTRRIARSLGDSWASCLDGRQCRISFPWVDTGQHVVLHANTSQVLNAAETVVVICILRLSARRVGPCVSDFTLLMTDESHRCAARRALCRSETGYRITASVVVNIDNREYLKPSFISK